MQSPHDRAQPFRMQRAGVAVAAGRLDAHHHTVATNLDNRMLDTPVTVPNSDLVVDEANKSHCTHTVTAATACTVSLGSLAME